MAAFDWASSAADFGMQMLSQDFQSDEATFARDWSASQARENRDFQERMRSTQYQTAVKDMQAAGLNPMLAYSQGGAGNLQGAVGQSSAASGVPPLRLSETNLRSQEAAKASSAEALLQAQKSNVEADTRVKEATEGEIRARTPTHAVSIEQMQQQIRESVQKISTLAAQASHHVASAGEAAQRTENLKAMLPQIAATVKQLESFTRLNDAQVKNLAVQMKKTEAETREILQRVKADLPSVLARLQDLQATATELDIPKKGRDADFHESFLGKLMSLLRNMNPLAGILGGGVR